MLTLTLALTCTRYVVVSYRNVAAILRKQIYLSIFEVRVRVRVRVRLGLGLGLGLGLSLGLGLA